MIKRKACLRRRVAACDLETSSRRHRRAIALDESEWILCFGLAQASYGPERSQALTKALELEAFRKFLRGRHRSKDVDQTTAEPRGIAA